MTCECKLDVVLGASKWLRKEPLKIGRLTARLSSSFFNTFPLDREGRLDVCLIVSQSGEDHQA